MKKGFLLLMLAVFAAAAYGFTSKDSYSWGTADRETTMAVVGGAASISAGQWVRMAYADTQTYGETCAVVVTAEGENSQPIIGVAEESGVGGKLIRICTYGPTTAYLSGVDSGSASGITNGTLLASSIQPGAAGAASTYMTNKPTSAIAGDTLTAMSNANASQTHICGMALEAVATTDTGLYTRYDVFVLAR